MNEGKKKKRSLQSIYIYFSEYTEEQVDFMLSQLSEEDMGILKKRYGEDLKKPKELGKLNEKEYAHFYNSMVIKMSRILSKMYPGVAPELDDVYGDKKGKYQRKNRSMKSIYIYFSEYTEEQVDFMLSQLPDKYMSILHNRYGEDLKNPKELKISEQENALLRGSLKNKMMRILRNKYPEVEKSSLEKTSEKESNLPSEKISIEDAVDESKSNVVEEMDTLEEAAEDVIMIEDEVVEEKASEKVVEEVSGEASDSNESSITESVTQDEKQVEQKSMLDEQIIGNDHVQVEVPLATEDKKDSITKEAYVEILEMLRTPTFGQLMTTLGPKDAVIISLRLGYVDGKYFSTESVSQFLGIPQEEVIDRTKNVLTMYRESFNDFIDKAIDATCEKSVQYVKKED